MEKTIIVDVDGVILDYYSGIFDEYSQHYTPCDNPDSLEDIFGTNVATGLVKLFSETEQFSKLEPYRNSETYLKNLHDEGFIIKAITACGNSIVTQQLRIENLINVFGDIFEEIITIGLGESKYNYLKQYANTNFVYVEDTYRHYVDGESLGLDSVMMETEFNKSLDTKMYNDWKDIYHYILSRYT